MIGIVGYGIYVPDKRITVEEIAHARSQNVNKIKSSLLIESKSVPAQDEDTATIAVAAAREAIESVRLNPSRRSRFAQPPQGERGGEVETPRMVRSSANCISNQGRTDFLDPLMRKYKSTTNSPVRPDPSISPFALPCPAKLCAKHGSEAQSAKSNGSNQTEPNHPVRPEERAQQSECLEGSNRTVLNIQAIYVGSESHPYAVKPTATIVGEALGIGNNYFAADLEFACKAGTAALQICYGLVKADMIRYGLAIGADTAQATPGDILEYSASAGGAAFIVGNREQEIIATIDHTLSVSSDTPDFWRRPEQAYPQHMNRFTGEPSYFTHVIAATERMLNETNTQPSDYDYVIFHQPNGKFPRVAAKKLGFTFEQLEPGLLGTTVGNTYSGNSMPSLAAVLDVAQPGQKILLTSYGSGSGSDSFAFTTTQNIEKK